MTRYIRRNQGDDALPESDDLKARLREWDWDPKHGDLFREALARIEELEVENRRLREALKDAAIVIEKMANGAGRKDVSPWLDRVLAALGEET